MKKIIHIGIFTVFLTSLLSLLSLPSAHAAGTITASPSSVKRTENVIITVADIPTNDEASYSVIISQQRDVARFTITVSGGSCFAKNGIGATGNEKLWVEEWIDRGSDLEIDCTKNGNSFSIKRTFVPKKALEMLPETNVDTRFNVQLFRVPFEGNGGETQEAQTNFTVVADKVTAQFKIESITPGGTPETPASPKDSVLIKLSGTKPVLYKYNISSPITGPANQTKCDNSGKCDLSIVMPDEINNTQLSVLIFEEGGNPLTAIVNTKATTKTGGGADSGGGNDVGNGSLPSPTISPTAIPTPIYAPCIEGLVAGSKTPVPIPTLAPGNTNKDEIEKLLKQITKCTKVDSALGPISTDPFGFIRFLFQLFLSISGGIAMLVIIAAGYRYMTSQGNAEAIKAAQEQITSAVVGLLFLVFSLVILQVIGVDLLQLPGLGK